MKKKAAWIITIILLLLSVPIYFLIAKGEVGIVKTAPELQELIDTKMPFNTENGDITVESVKILFDDENLVLRIKVSGKKWKQTFSADVTAIGVPEYKEGALYFKAKDVEINHIEVSGLEGSSSIASKTAEKTKDFLKRYITNEGAQNAIDDLAPKFEEWIKGAPEKAVVFVLNRVPVYKFKDDVKGWIITGSLNEDSIKIADNKLTLTLDFVQLTVIILIWLATIVGAIAWLIVCIRDKKARDATLEALGAVAEVGGEILGAAGEVIGDIGIDI